MRTVVCPGSFDPITLGHLDVIERAAALFDKVVVCVMVNGGKNSGMFTGEERLELVKLATEHLDNVEAVRCDGLLAEFAKAQGFALGKAMSIPAMWLIHLRSTASDPAFNYAATFYKLLCFSLLFALIGTIIFLMGMQDKAKVRKETVELETLRI